MKRTPTDGTREVGSACPDCGRGVGVWFAPDESPCSCQPASVETRVVSLDAGWTLGGRYFVLDLDRDPHAIPALTAYRDSCRAEYPELASDLTAQLYVMRLSLDPNRRRDG